MTAEQRVIIPAADVPSELSAEDIQQLLSHIAPMLHRGEVIRRDSVTVFLTAPRIEWTTPDLLRVLFMLEQSSEFNADAMSIIRALISIIKALISPQNGAFRDRLEGHIAVVGEVRETIRTVRLSSVSLSDSAADAIQHARADAWHEYIPVEQPSPARKTDRKPRKKRVADARKKADAYLKRYPSARQLSARDLGRKLGISRQVASEALAYAREFPDT